MATVDLVMDQAVGRGPWNHAIFAGSGQGGDTMNGGVGIRGSVYVGGPGEVEVSGGADILNHYRDIGTVWGAAAAKFPPPRTVMLDGVEVETLDTHVWVSESSIRKTGAVSWGESESTGDTYKDTLDEIVYGGATNTTSHMRADLVESSFPAEKIIDFPAMTDASVYEAGKTHRSYLEDNAMMLPVSTISDSTPAFSVTDPSTGSVVASWDPDTLVLRIDGMVKVAGDLTLGSAGGGGPNATVSGILYEGVGTLYAPGNVQILGDVVPHGNYVDPSNTNSLGVVTDGDVLIPNTSKVFAAVYAEGAVRLEKKALLAGAIVSNFYDLGRNNPQVWQVPTLVDHLPPGMPNGRYLTGLAFVGFDGWYVGR